MKFTFSLEKLSISIESDHPVRFDDIPILGALLGNAAANAQREAILTSPQHPGKTFTLAQAAAMAGVTESGLTQAIRKGRPLKCGTSFEKNSAGIIPHYDLGGHRTRGEAAGDLMPTNGQRIPAAERKTPKDIDASGL